MFPRALFVIGRALALLCLFCLATPAFAAPDPHLLAMGGSGGDASLVRPGDRGEEYPFERGRNERGAAEQRRLTGSPGARPGAREGTPPGTPESADDQRPLVEQLFAGSAVGSLIFGYPMQGVGMPDLLLLVFVVFTLLRAVNRNRQGASGRRGDSKFETGDWSAGSGRNADDGNDENVADTDAWNRLTRDKTAKRRDAGDDGRDDDGRDDDGRANDGSRGLAWPDKNRAPRAPRSESDAGRQNEAPSPPQAPRRAASRRATTKEQAALMWKRLQNGPADSADSGTTTDSAGSGAAGNAGFGRAVVVEQGVRLPQGFDAADFLEGARALYARLQTSWAARDVNDLAPFTTPAMLDLLRDEAGRNPEAAYVEVLLVEASLSAYDEDRGTAHASVSFSALLRHAPGENPAKTRELWTFVRDTRAGGTWRLDGITD